MMSEKNDIACAQSIKQQEIVLNLPTRNAILNKLTHSLLLRGSQVEKAVRSCAEVDFVSVGVEGGSFFSYATRDRATSAGPTLDPH